jgi:hypothetical protein
MGFFKVFSVNGKKWYSVLGDKDVPEEFKKIVYQFFLKDNIDFDKYVENQKANSLIGFLGLKAWETANSLSIYDEVRDEKINCTKTFREHFADDRLNRALGIPDWFYIAYPDVALWLGKNLSLFERELELREKEFIIDDKPNLKVFRFFIDKYFLSTGEKLECRY